MIEGLVMQECNSLYAIVIAIRFLTQELISSSEKPKEKRSNVGNSIKRFFSNFFTIWLDRFKQQGTHNPADDRAFKSFLSDLRNPKNLFFYDENMISEETMYHSKSFVSNITLKMQESNRTCIDISEFKRYVRRK